MRIGISALHFTPGAPSSPERYLTGIINNLVRFDRQNEYILFTRPENRAYFDMSHGNVRDIVFPSILRHVWIRVLCEQLILPFLVLFLKIDLFHFPATVGPALLPCKSVGTVHSVIDPLLGKTLPWYRRLYFAVMYRISTARANRLIAVSEDCRREMVKWLGIRGEKIEVVHHGVEPHFEPDGPPGELQACTARHGIRKEYVFCVAAPATHKNITRLLKAYCRMRAATGLKHAFVLVGGPKDRFEKFIQEGTSGDQTGAIDDILCLGYVTHADLLCLYRGARLLVNVSYNETFGFPPLEAMASGTPVVVSNITALPETVGEAGILVDPFSVEDIAAGMGKVLQDEKMWSELRTKGLARAKLFTWERAARQTFAIYEDVATRAGEQNWRAAANNGR